MSDPDIIEVAVQALQQGDISASNEELLALAIAAVTPLILERAAKVAEERADLVWEDDGGLLHSTRILHGREIAAAIRALNKPMEKTMTEREREARHPQSAPDTELKRCPICNGTGTVGRASSFTALPSGEVEKKHWDSICPVCEGRGYERARSTATAH